MRLRENRPENGRKGFQITPDILKQVEKFAGLGSDSRADRALPLGISHETFHKQKRNSSDFVEAIKRGQTQSYISGEVNALFENAMSGNAVTAQIFWLKNRAPEMWAGHDSE